MRHRRNGANELLFGRVALRVILASAGSSAESRQCRAAPVTTERPPTLVGHPLLTVPVSCGSGHLRGLTGAALCIGVLGACEANRPPTAPDMASPAGRDSSPPSPAFPPSPPLGAGPESCANGRAGDFPCDGISLRSRVALGVMGGTFGNDLWGWSDGDAGPEYAVMGLDTGTAFVDVSNPEDPVFLGRLPTETWASFWRDIKVYREHAFVVADDAGAHGMQVFDLARLRGSAASQTFDADVVYREFESAHNLAINEETGFAYAVASATCEGGLHIVDLQVPTNPQFRACHAAARVHDVQCVVYRGPDAEHLDREICLSSNEDHVAVVDVTDKTALRILSSTTYPELGFVHQGWLTADHRFFLLGDEDDEIAFGVRTRMHVFDVSDLDTPKYLFPHELETRATDHNLYVRGNLVFAANYSSGLRVLEMGELANRELREVAFFDTFPQGDGVDLNGAWSVYPYLPSGTVIVSDIHNGLFVLSLP